MVSIRHTLLIGATTDTIYQAITTAEGLSSWWTPKTEAKAETGTVASFPFANGYVKKMQILELRPNEYVKWQCIDGDREWIGTIISFLLLQRNDDDLLAAHPEVAGQAEQNQAAQRTLLVFEHNDWKNYSASFGECSYTWAQFLRSLRALCEVGKGFPWPEQHRL